MSLRGELVGHFLMHPASRSGTVRQLALAKFQCRGKVKEGQNSLTCLSSWREIDSKGRITCMGCHKQKRGKMATLVNKHRMGRAK